MEEVDDLLKGFLGFVLSGYVLEGDAGLLFHIDLSFVLADAAHHAFAAHAPGDQAHEQERNAEHHHIGKDHGDEGVVLHDLFLDFYTLSRQTLGHSHGVTAGGQAGIAGFLLGRLFGGFGLGQVDDAVVLQLHLGQIAGLFFLEEVGEGGLGVLAVNNGIVDAAEQQHNGHRK